ncbi:uncharacterized protein E1O_07540 [Burkholderiales bacterium GJ-E10]|nr:uncharacterized protein E1O_07540 [Burkholderiales bacterium GJ-E10]
MDRAPLVLVTRPERPGRLLAARLRDAGSGSGVSALWWPAFDLVPLPEDPALQAALARLAGFNLAVFVSPAAARACARALRAPWPASTAIAAVGAGTRQAVLACIPEAGRARIVAPSDDAAAGGGSEALLSALRQADLAPARVLVVRAQRGRELLADALAQAGALVEQVAAYRRTVHRPDSCAWAALRAIRDLGRPIVPFLSSSEGVDALREQLAAGMPPLPWNEIRAALCLHPRIAGALAARGVADAIVCDADAASILDGLRRAPETRSGTLAS